MKKKQKCIAIIEDEKTLANLIESGLKEEGFDVCAATDGRKGLSLIVKKKPHLVLLDMMLPGLNGFDILEKLEEKGILPDMPVVIISNSGEPIEIERALKLGVRDYLIKVNFNPNEVIEKVKNVLKAESERKKKKTTPAKVVKGRQVLLVEDDMILSDVLERKFVEKKYTVHKASNADSARKILAQEEIDLILLDVVLPDEHGISLLKEFKKDERVKNIPVIIASNLGQKEEIDEGLRSGAVDYIVKTNTVPEEIFQKVEVLLTKVN